jgi:hypothetical protein
MGARAGAPQSLWGFDRSGWGFGVRATRLVGPLVDVRACEWGVIEVSAGVER